MKRPPVYDSSKAQLLPWIPDSELIRILTKHGMPFKDANNGIKGGGMRIFATSFYFDVEAAGAGDKDAKERIDYCRHIWNEQRKAS